MKGTPLIYTVTSVHFRGEKERRDTRCWGWWPTKEQAIKSIEVNDCDMHEMSYNYLVLESVPPYMCNLKGYTKIWYTWRGHIEHGRWEKCKEPTWAKRVVGWGIG